MQDNIPDALITAFERQYDSSWNDPQLRNERLAMRYGWAAAVEAKQCLHQIQEPTVNQQLTVAPMAAMTNALREAEAALEVAMARILKADPGYSISVTSEAKALVAVRQALSAQAAPVAVGEREAFEAAFIAEKLRMIGCNESDSEAVRAIRMCHLQRYGDGKYPLLEAYFAWFAWQAGRAALAANPQNHIADAGKMVENVREGDPYDNPEFEQLARDLGVWGTPQSAIGAQFWMAARNPAAPVALSEPDFWVRPGATIHPDRGWQCWSNDGTATGAFHADTVRALLAGVSAPAAQPERKYICPVRTIADLVNNLMLMDQAMPIYGAQYIERPAGQRRAIAVPPTVSIERVKDSRWIGEGETLNTAIIWTRAEQPAAPQAQAVGRGEVLVTVSGFTGSGKSAIAGEIEILCRALGLQVEWPDGESEKNMTHADWTAALEQYKPRVRIVEQNIPFVSKKGLSK